MAKKPLHDLIVLLPGITGSVLQKDGKDIWATSGQAFGRWLLTGGNSLQELRVTDEDGAGISATRVMPDAHIVPGLVRIDGYSTTAKMIRDNFDVRVGSLVDKRPANYLEFPYDWRLDNRHNARLLNELVRDRLAIWRTESSNGKARVIFLAHSMGGLIARYALEVLEGWRDCKALITFGTPYRGSLNSLNFLANGYKGLLFDLTEVMRSMPSVYQLLPIYPVVQPTDAVTSMPGSFVRVAEGPALPGIDRALAQDALRFHREIENKVNEHLGDAAYRERGYKILPIVGTRQPTFQSASFVRGKVTLREQVPDSVDPILGDGDGTVPRASAIPIELSDAYRDTFLPERHGSLQRNPAILSDLLGRIQQMQAKNLSAVRGPSESLEAAERAAIALDVDDSYAANEAVELRARIIGGDWGPPRARVEAVDAQAPTSLVVDFTHAESIWKLELPGLTPGLYRVEVSSASAAPGTPSPVTELFEVYGVA